MSKLRIYPIILIAIFLFSIYLPKVYKDIFSSRLDTQRVVYSPVEKDFLKISTYNDNKRRVVYSNLDESEVYTIDEFKSKLPFRYYYDLLRTNNFPEEFISYSTNIAAIKSEKSYIKIKPSFINQKMVNLYPLFESNPKYSGLTLPEDLFRLDEKGITFINSSTNKVDEEKTKQYNVLFLEAEAVFPLVNLYGTPSTQKSFDEGYFISDAKNQLFHLKQTNSIPSLKKVNLDGIDIKFFLMKEDPRREYYGVVVDKKSNLYLMMYDNYELVKLPINNYNYKTDEFKISTTPLNRIIEIVKINEAANMKSTFTTITNLDYEIIKQNSFDFVYEGNKIYESMKNILFPFRLVITKSTQGYYDFEIRDLSQISLYINFVLALCLLIFIKLSNRSFKKHIVQALLVALGGIYSLIALILFNKLLEEKLTKGKK